MKLEFDVNMEDYNKGRFLATVEYGFRTRKEMLESAYQLLETKLESTSFVIGYLQQIEYFDKVE